MTTRALAVLAALATMYMSAPRADAATFQEAFTKVIAKYAASPTKIHAVCACQDGSNFAGFIVANTVTVDAEGDQKVLVRCEVPAFLDGNSDGTAPCSPFVVIGK